MACLTRIFRHVCSTVKIVCAAACLICGVAAIAHGQTEESYESRRSSAFELCRDNRFVDAVPSLEKLHAEKPDDIAVTERLSFALGMRAATLTDPAERKQERVRARKLAEEASEAGDTRNLVKIMLSSIPPDGSEQTFSVNAAVQAAMQEGEAAFAKGDFDGAVEAYGRALALDPHTYDAAVFTGDVYYKKKEYEKAASWFAKAVEIDANRETGYHFWGDDLMAQGLVSDAKEQFINAVVAEPYNQRSWMGLSQWAKNQKMTLGHPQIKSPNQITDATNDGKKQTNIVIDASTLQGNAKKDGTDAWFSYTLFRAVWHGDKFQKEFPKETEYRHSLPEEVDGLQGVVNQVKEEMAQKKITQLDPALAMLVKISDEGLLEPYILISRTDQGIARDYAAYRDAHREKVRQYISEWIIHPAP